MEGSSVGFRFGVWKEEGGVTSSNYIDFRDLVGTIGEVGIK